VVSVRGRFSVRLVGEFLLHACYVFDGECRGMMWILVVLARGYKPSRGFAAAVGGVDRFMVAGRVDVQVFVLLRWLEMVSWRCSIPHRAFKSEQVKVQFGRWG